MESRISQEYRVMSTDSVRVKEGSFEVLLNGHWDFSFTRPSSMTVPAIPDDDVFDTQITVPGRWDDQIEILKHAKWFADAEFETITSSGFAAGSRFGDIKYLYGNGWYRRYFNASADWQGRNIRLTIGRTMGKIDLWLNKKHLGSFDYGNYVPYEIDITEHLMLGQDNELIISVDNTKGFEVGYASVEPHGKVGEISRDVALTLSAGAGKIIDTYIHPGKSLEDVVWEVELQRSEKNTNTTGSKILWEVRDRENANILAQDEVDVEGFTNDHKIQWAARIEQILPWSDRHPNLYWTNLKWIGSDGNVLDNHSQRFGLRRFRYKGRKCFLNDKPCYLRGDFVGGYYPVICAVPTTKEYWLMCFSRMKTIGMNYLNFANQVCPVEMMEAADEVGIILQCGDSATALNIPDYQRRYKDVWMPIVCLTRKYPSICIYGFNGELDYYEGIIEQFQKLYDLIKLLHPESMVMPQQALRGIDYVFDEKAEKELTQEPFPHHAERLAQYTKACDFFGHYSCGALSYSYDKPPLWHEMDERFAIYTRPISAHELFMGACYLNPENAAKYTGRIPPTLYDILEQDLSRAGMLDKWVTYYNNASRLQGICKKYNLEKVRKCHELVAYEILGMRDQHFVPHYTTGILDEFFGIKPGDTVERIRSYMDESVLLLDYDGGESINRSFYAQTPFTAKIMVSLFGEKPLVEGRLSWELWVGNETLQRESFKVSNIANGAVNTLEPLHIRWPNVTKTTKLTLAVHLTGSGYDISNDWDFWVFAKLSPPIVNAASDEENLARLQGRYESIKPLRDYSDQKLWIVSEMGDREIEHIEKGGDILLLNTKVFPVHSGFVNFRSGLGGRAHHNVGKVIAPHPIFENLPHEGWGNWHFYYVFDEAKAIVFDGLEKDYGVSFDPIVEVISSAAEIRKQALIFEKKVGRGRLFVSNCIYKDDNPACVALMDGIMAYIQSRAFKPKTEMEVDILKQCIKPSLPEEPGNLLKGVWLQNCIAPGEDKRSDVVAHTGKKAMRFELSLEDLSVGKRQFGIRTGPQAFENGLETAMKTIKFSAWCKADNVDAKKGDGKLFCIAKIRYEQGDDHEVSLEFDTDKVGWQYVEACWTPDRSISTYNIMMGLLDCIGTVWFDGVYLGYYPHMTAAGSDDLVTDITWSNQPMTIELEFEKLFSINGGPWKKGTTIDILQVGIHSIAMKNEQTDADVQVRQVGIDIEPPVIELTTEPIVDQEAGLYIGATDTVFTIKATSRLSPISSIDISIDGELFKPYSEPFTLPSGRHDIRCKVVDVAGNRNEILTGESLSGGDTSRVMLDIRM